MFGALFAGTANFLFLIFFIGGGFASRASCFVFFISSLVGIFFFVYSLRFMKSQKSIERFCGGLGMFLNAFVGVLSLLVFFACLK